MKRAISCLAAVFVCLVLSSLPAHAQYGWFWQNPKPVGDGLGKVRFFSTTEGWITTEAGQLLHTTDGGATWKLVSPDSALALTTILEPDGPASSFISAAAGWVVGIQGGFNNPQGPFLYKTTNGGANWVSQPLGTGVTGAIFGIGVQFLNSSLGWATVASGSFPTNVAGVLRKSTDGGSTWATTFSAPTNNGVFSLDFLDASNGWALMDSISTAGDLVAPAKIMHTTDGGTTWLDQAVSSTPGIFSALQMTDLSNGWVVGDSAKIFHTTDGGTSWIQVTNTGIASSSRVRGLYFLSGTVGWLASQPPASPSVILHTTDGGTSWTTQNPGLQFTVRGIHFIDANNGWAAFDMGGIAHTTDGGTTWNPQSSAPFTSTLRGVATLPADLGRAWAVGEFGTVLHTTDGGTNWAFQTSGTPNHLNGVKFVDANTGYAAGNQIVLKTINGGSNWNTATPASPPVFNAVDFVDASTGSVAGNAGNVFRTTDGGTTWTPQSAGGSDQLGIFLNSASVGTAVGKSGSIHRTTDGGTNWGVQTSGTLQNLNGVFFADLNSGWAVGDTGTILHTSNAGTNWNAQTSGTVNNLKSVFFTSTTNGWVVGDGNLILHTINGGTTWSREFGGTSFSGLQSASFSSANSGAAVGHNGTVLHFGQVPTGLTDQRVNRPAGFELSQNYPNPFNPATTIRFSLPARQKIGLEIFNLLGERIRLLASEEFSAGEHALVWDGKDEKGKPVSSGIYFYRLRGESYAETKKMILVK